MCGRFTQKNEKKTVEKEFGVEIRKDQNFSQSYNIAPTQFIGAIRVVNELREFANLKWGLIPSWSKDDSFAAKLINARAETLSEKPSFREAYKRRRCLIPASGFYEWEKTASGKQPHYFYMKDSDIFGFGGLWEEWIDRDSGELVETCTIITTTANKTLEQIHHRMPVIIKQTDYEKWLDNEKFAGENKDEFFDPFPSDKMDTYPVSRAVNSAANHGAGLIEKLNSK